MGTGEASMMAWRMASMLPPVDRSITVSAPRCTAVCSFSSSSSILLVTAELPMLALILHFDATPMAIGSSFFLTCSTLAGMTIRPRATSSRISSASRSSRWATKRISSVITPLRADSIWVMKKPLLRRGQQPPREHQILAEQLGEQQQRYPGNKQKEREHAQALHHVF